MEGGPEMRRSRVFALVVWVVLVTAGVWSLCPPVPAGDEARGRAAGKARIVDQVKVSIERSLTPEEERALSRAAGRILKHVDQARHALASGDWSTALEHVRKGLLLVAIIDEVSPVYRVDAIIKAGKLEYRDTDYVKPTLIPIYDELEKAEILRPVREAKLEKARKEVQKGERPPFVADVLLRATKVELDVANAKSGLVVAERLVRKLAESSGAVAGKKAEKGTERLGDKERKRLAALADAALMSIQTGVIFEYAAVDLPLERARINLKLAADALRRDDKAEAAFLLGVARDALENYAAGVGEERAKEVEALRKEIESMLAHIGQSGSIDAKKVDSWWDRVVKWFK